MNRHLATVIDFTGSLSRCDAAWQMAQGSKPAGMPVAVAYAHDLGRERHEINPSGEGTG